MATKRTQPPQRRRHSTDPPGAPSKTARIDGNPSQGGGPSTDFSSRGLETTYNFLSPLPTPTPTPPLTTTTATTTTTTTTTSAGPTTSTETWEQIKEWMESRARNKYPKIVDLLRRHYKSLSDENLDLCLDFLPQVKVDKRMVLDLLNDIKRWKEVKTTAEPPQTSSPSPTSMSIVPRPVSPISTSTNTDTSSTVPIHTSHASIPSSTVTISTHTTLTSTHTIPPTPIGPSTYIININQPQPLQQQESITSEGINSMVDKKVQALRSEFDASKKELEETYDAKIKAMKEEFQQKFEQQSAEVLELRAIVEAQAEQLRLAARVTTVNERRNWRDRCCTLLSVNKPEDKVLTRYKCFCQECDWKSHKTLPVRAEEEGNPQSGSRQERLEGATINAYILHVKRKHNVDLRQIESGHDQYMPVLESSS